MELSALGRQLSYDLLAIIGYIGLSSLGELLLVVDGNRAANIHYRLDGIILTDVFLHGEPHLRPAPLLLADLQ